MRTGSVSSRVCIFLLLVPCSSFGDSWVAAAPMVIASPDGDRLVRIEPGNNIGGTVGFKGAARGAFASATYYRHDDTKNSYDAVHKVTLQNPVAPVRIHLNNAGTLVTVDNWHNAGYGAVLAIYRDDGELLKKYSLEDLYEIDRIRNFTHSVSSRWWRCNQVEAWMNDREFVLTDAFGGVFRFDLQSGDYTYDGSGNACPTALPGIAS